MSSSYDVIGIGPLSPPITGPGLKNKYLLAGLRSEGVSVKWINTLNHSLGTVQDILRSRFAQQYIISSSTKERFFLTMFLYDKLIVNRSSMVLLPMGGKLHDEINNSPIVFKGIYKKGLQNYDMIYPESKLLCRVLENSLGSSNIHELSNLRPQPEAAPKMLRDTSEMKAVYVGRIKEKKGLNTAISAIEECISDDMKIKFDIFGQFLEGDDYKDIFVEKCESSTNINYLGRIPDGKVIKTLSNYDVFIFPSYYDGEGFPGVLIEALMSGCAIVATNWNSNPEIVTEGENGYLFEPKNDKDLKEKLTILYENPGLNSRLMENAWLTSDKYSVENVTKEFMQSLYDLGWDI